MTTTNDLLAKAVATAALAHREQLYGGKLYVAHLAAVVFNLHRLGFLQLRLEEDLFNALEIAGWLHDVVEDTPMTLEKVRSEFGDDVAELVGAVTTEPGANRKARNAATYPKIAKLPGAVLLKLADRIANVEESWATKDTRLFMYQREYRDFRKALRDPGYVPAQEMWKHLDGLLGWWEA